MSTPTQDYPYYPPQQHHVTPSKGLGIAAMVVGIVALVLAFIPVIGFISFVLGPIAVILGIIGLVKKNGKGQSIAGIVTGALGFFVVLVGTLLFGAFIDAFDEEMQSAESDEVEAEVAEEQAEDQSDAAELQEEEGEEPEPAAPAGDEGSRENPLPIGETVSNEDWELTVNSVTMDADDQIASENEFSDPAPEGSSYALINITATYSGDESEMPMLGTEIAYVTGSGETSNAFDQLAIAPDEFDAAAELYAGGTEEGNVVLAIPDADEEGALRVRLGFIASEDYFFQTQ